MENRVSLIFDWKGRLKSPTLNAHMNDNSLVKIIPLKYVKNIPGVRVNMDTLIEKAMNVIMRDETVFKFKEC